MQLFNVLTVVSDLRGFSTSDIKEQEKMDYAGLRERFPRAVYCIKENIE